MKIGKNGLKSFLSKSRDIRVRNASSVTTFKKHLDKFRNVNFHNVPGNSRSVYAGNSHTKFLSAFRYNLPLLFISNHWFFCVKVSTVLAISLILLLRDWAIYGRNIADTSQFLNQTDVTSVVFRSVLI